MTQGNFLSVDTVFDDPRCTVPFQYLSSTFFQKIGSLLSTTLAQVFSGKG